MNATTQIPAASAEGSATDLHRATDQSMTEANDMLLAAYELAMDDSYLGSSDPAAQSIVTLIRVARERVEAAITSHGAEGAKHTKARSDKVQAERKPTTDQTAAKLRVHASTMQDKQCLLTGVLEAIQRIDNEAGTDGALTALIQTAIQQANEVYEGLDSVNLPG